MLQTCTNSIVRLPGTCYPLLHQSAACQQSILGKQLKNRVLTIPNPSLHLWSSTRSRCWWAQWWYRVDTTWKKTPTFFFFGWHGFVAFPKDRLDKPESLKQTSWVLLMIEHVETWVFEDYHWSLSLQFVFRSLTSTCHESYLEPTILWLLLPKSVSLHGQKKHVSYGFRTFTRSQCVSWASIKLHQIATISHLNIIPFLDPQLFREKTN